MHPERRSFQISTHHIKDTADTHGQHRAQLFLMAREPFLLLRHPKAHQEEAGAAGFDVRNDFLFFGLIEIAIMAAHQGKCAVILHEGISRLLSHAGSAA